MFRAEVTMLERLGDASEHLGATLVARVNLTEGGAPVRVPSKLLFRDYKVWLAESPTRG